MTEENKSDYEIMTEALHKARERFQTYIREEYGLDSAFFDIRLTGYVLDRDFLPWKKVTIHPEFETRKEREEIRDEEIS